MNLRVKHSAVAMIAVGALTLTLGACDTSSGTSGGSTGNAAQNAQQQKDNAQLEFVQPIPFFPYSEIRQNLIEIEAIQALGISSTSFVFIQGIDHPVLVCPSQGVPVPATDEMTNPVVPVWNSGSWSQGYAVAGVGVGQQDPVGVFQGDTTGTNGLCLNNAGQPYDIYNEAQYVTVTANAVWNKSTGMIDVLGAPVMPTCTVHVIDASRHKAEEICTAPQKSERHGFKHPTQISPPAGTVTPAPSSSK